MKRIHKVKTAVIVKDTIPDEKIEILRDNCNNLRDRAMIDFLLSTGIRVGELVRLNIDDIDFWVKGYEYLRQLEYKIAILGDKWEYLGEDCCSEEEKKLASLREFPPLSYLFYPAASLAYVREKEEPWKCSPLAAKLVEEAAKQEKDTWFAKMVSLYKRYPVRVLARYIAWMFHREAHKRVTDHLIRQMDQAAAIYPRRYFGEENEKKHKILFEKANKRKRDLEKQGIQAEIFREEPFAKGDDGPFKVYVMQFTVKKGNRISAVEEIR